MFDTVYGSVQALDWLCLAPHPDDAEIGAGGTLIRLARAGKKVGILELSRGEGGTQGSVQERAAECVNAASIMGLAWRGQLGLPDGGLIDLPEEARALAAALRAARPRVLVVPHHRDRHPDSQRDCGRAVRAASYSGARSCSTPSCCGRSVRPAPAVRWS